MGKVYENGKALHFGSGKAIVNTIKNGINKDKSAVKYNS